MKILFVTPGCYDKGGISRYNRYQIRVLREQFGENNVRVVSLLGPDANSFEGSYDVYWHGKGIGLISKLKLIWHVLNVTCRWRPDQIFIGHVNLSGFCVAIARLFRVKSILNVYGLEVWSRMRRDAFWGLRHVNAIISDCYNTASYLESNNIRRKADISVIWDCIDLLKFQPAIEVDNAILSKYSLPNPKNYFVVLTLGRLALPDALYKGYERLLKVVVKLHPTFPQLRLVIAGRGDYQEVLKKKAAESNLQEVVSFTGSIDEDHLENVYQACHLFSLVTEAGEGKGEGIPLTPLEAMACGKPILVGNQDGSREAVVDGLNGFVLDPLDLELHAKSIQHYIESPDHYAQHATSALSVAHEMFSYLRFKNETLQFIEKIKMH